MNTSGGQGSEGPNGCASIFLVSWAPLTVVGKVLFTTVQQFGGNLYISLQEQDSK